ncbi:MAG: methylmalonyl-CoA decarboxylase [Elusimicrobia bacterium RIFOXYB2_FULL_62_6]|nr:MAG: methylmalonyl-CoA decarboxylase [Elusimicrobia bacterium RIFOXYB2_FULL_62_6]
MGLVLMEMKDDIGVLTLNNPDKRNALTFAMCAELCEWLEELKRKRVPVVVLRAPKGSKTWSAGHDVSQLPKVTHEPFAYDSPMEKALRAIQEFPGPVIAMVQGGVWGGSSDLVVTCDLIIGDETASFAITPVKIGLPYNASGILHFINRVGLNIAKEMFFTAAPMGAARAHQCGILNHLVPAAELEEFTFSMAKSIASNSHLAVAVIKEQFRLLAEAHPITPDAFERIQALRRKVYNSHDYEEGINSFLEKRKPKFTGE